MRNNISRGSRGFSAIAKRLVNYFLQKAMYNKLALLLVKRTVNGPHLHA